MSICRHFPECGGCQTQHLSYAEQLRAKREHVQRLLRDAAPRRAPRVAPVLAMPVGADGMPRHFRHKAAFVFAPAGRGGRGLVMGHYAAGSKRVVPIEECPVHSERANRLAFALGDRLRKAGISAAGPRLDGIVRHLVVRTTHDDSAALALLVVTRNDKSLRAPLRAWLASAERPDALFVTEHDRDDPYMLGKSVVRIDGPTHIRETRIGPTLLLSPTAFFQTNPDGAAALVAEVVAQVTAVAMPARVLDLYAGSGLFALPLAMAGHEVRAVEENRHAVKDGIANARLNRVESSRLTFVAARTDDHLRRVWGATPDAVVIDPPRQGCGPRVIDDVFRRLSPSRAIYVSCNPEAFARELPDILDAGYMLTRVLPVDMFPHTTHIELVATLDHVRAGRVRAGLAPPPLTSEY